MRVDDRCSMLACALFSASNSSLVVDNSLYVGSTGKAWIDPTTNEEVNTNRMWVKRVGAHQSVEHISWHHVYKRIAKVMFYEYALFVGHDV